jgi:hypothetical protein
MNPDKSTYFYDAQKEHSTYTFPPNTDKRDERRDLEQCYPKVRAGECRADSIDQPLFFVPFLRRTDLLLSVQRSPMLALHRITVT